MKQAQLSQDRILQALADIKDPEQGKDIVQLGMVKGVQLSDQGDVVFMIEVDASRGPALEPLRQEAEKVVANLPGVGKVTAVLTAQKPAAPSPKNDPHGMAKNPKLDLPIKHIIAVASGKGGVGKSTVSSNIARALAANSQLKIGLLDADIYGPSQPRMMGLEGQKPQQTTGQKNAKIIPPVADNVKVMSIGFMVDAQAPLVWRGPMVQTAIYQLLRDVQWSTPLDDGTEEPLDILIVDMPPGTGDAQLTMAQKVPMAGAIIVSTPQDLALLDARKAIEMFRKVDVPILGLIENMSTHICSNCGHEEHIFGHGGAREEAEKRGVPFLGEIPLSMEIRQASDAGAKSSVTVFSNITEKIIQDIS